MRHVFRKLSLELHEQQIYQIVLIHKIGSKRDQRPCPFKINICGEQILLNNRIFCIFNKHVMTFEDNLSPGPSYLNICMVCSIYL